MMSRAAARVNNETLRAAVRVNNESLRAAVRVNNETLQTGASLGYLSANLVAPKFNASYTPRFTNRV